MSLYHKHLTTHVSCFNVIQILCLVQYVPIVFLPFPLFFSDGELVLHFVFESFGFCVVFHFQFSVHLCSVFSISTVSLSILFKSVQFGVWSSQSSSHVLCLVSLQVCVFSFHLFACSFELFVHLYFSSCLFEFQLLFL